MEAIITEYPQFFTATILNWKKLLKPAKYKDIVIESLHYLVENKRINFLPSLVVRYSAKAFVGVVFWQVRWRHQQNEFKRS